MQPCIKLSEKWEDVINQRGNRDIRPSLHLLELWVVHKTINKYEIWMSIGFVPETLYLSHIRTRSVDCTAHLVLQQIRKEQLGSKNGEDWINGETTKILDNLTSSALWLRVLPKQSTNMEDECRYKESRCSHKALVMKHSAKIVLVLPKVLAVL